MTENKENIVLTRQTVDLPTDLMEHFDRIKRRRGFRSFSAYAVSLIEADQQGLIKPISSDSQIGTQPDIDTASEAFIGALERIETLTARLTAQVARLERAAGGKDSQKRKRTAAAEKPVSVRTRR